MITEHLRVKVSASVSWNSGLIKAMTGEMIPVTIRDADISSVPN